MMTTTVIRHLDRPGGRRVAVHELTSGAPADAPIVLFCHAAPGSASFDPDPAATAAHGVRLVALDRPGYGGSDPVDEGSFATVDSAADDAAAALEAVLSPGETAGVAGWSAGGRVALALAARRPDLVGRAAVIATPAPDEEVPWIPPEHRAGIDALRGAAPADAHAALTEAMAPLAALTGDDRFGIAGVSDADAPQLAMPGVADRLRAMLDAAQVRGDKGMVADIAGYSLRPWGFDPADVGSQVLLGYGTADFVGPAHARWYQRVLPDARLRLVPDAGHLVVVPIWPEVLSHLAPTR